MAGRLSGRVFPEAEGTAHSPGASEPPDAHPREALAVHWEVGARLATTGAHVQQWHSSSAILLSESQQRGEI